MGPNWGTFGANGEFDLLDIPSIQTLREWKQLCVRAVAGAWHGAKAAQLLIMGAMGPRIPKGESPGSRGLRAPHYHDRRESA
eukprot:8380850-Pyramimonas_sp.AAC.1